MSLRLYNSLTKTEEEFVPLQKGSATIYTCGPTVYGRPHIGNYSSFLMADLLCRWLEVSGYNVTHVKNITDVGHLVTDADTGEDKIEKQAREEKTKRGDTSSQLQHEDIIGIARTYEEQYIEDEKALNFRTPEQRPRATEYINAMKDMIETLLQKGHAYQTEDGIYFDVTSETPTPYGTLSGNTLENLSSGARVEVREGKKHPADFALWKFCVGENEHHVLRWSSPGENNPEGFPGWHIECSAMSASLLGDQIDIHTGGEDNIFPHHECEIAQSECVSGKKPFVKLWLHRRRIDMGKEKMSKSLGNVLTLPDVMEMGYDPMDLRCYLLSVHYRTNLKFAEKGLDDARKARKKIVEWMREVEDADDAKEGAEEWKQKFSQAMDSDLNTPEALAVIFDAMAWSRNEGMLGACKELVDIIRQTFGCFEPSPEAQASVPAQVQALVEKRAQARADKDFAASDALRDQIAELGYDVKDTSEGQKLERL